MNYKSVWIRGIEGGEDGTATLVMDAETTKGNFHSIKVAIDGNNVRQLAQGVCAFIKAHEDGFKERQRNLRKAMNYGNTEAQITYYNHN